MENWNHGGKIRIMNPGKDDLGFLFDELVLHGVVHEFGVVFHAHLFKDAGAVGADGFDAEGEFAGDFADHFSGSNQAQHLKFTIGKSFLGSFLVFAAGEIGGKFFSQGITDVTATGEDFANRPDQLFGSAFLGHVTGSAPFENADSELIFGMHAQDENRKFRFGLFDFAQDLEATAARHGDIEHDDVPILFPNEVERFLGVSGFAESCFLEFVGEDLSQTVPDDGVIISE